MSNESKWMTLVSGIIAAVIPLLVAYGVITSEQGELWQGLALAIVAAIVAIVVPLAVTSLAKNYNDNSTLMQVSRDETERAQLMAGVREQG